MMQVIWSHVPSVLVASLCVLIVMAEEVETTTEFQSRPDIIAPVLEVTQYDHAKLAPGYWFTAPHSVGINLGPYIYDNSGELVWSGSALTGDSDAQNVQPFTYNGTNYLSFFLGQSNTGHSHGTILILDSSYRIVHTVRPGGTLADFGADMHEFRIVDGGQRVLLIVCKPVQWDLSALGNGFEDGLGWVMDVWWQELDIWTGEVLLKWRALDWFDPVASKVPPSKNTGEGERSWLAWDWFHLNSVDKTPTGEYLISSRSYNSVFLYSAQRNSIVWTVGGANSSFNLTNFNFSAQHDVRIHPSTWAQRTPNTTLLTFLDNGATAEHTADTSSSSSGLLVLLDHAVIPATATLLTAYPAPHNISAVTQGSMQILPSGNVAMGWGSMPWLSEYAANGELLLEGVWRELLKVTDPDDKTKPKRKMGQNYRAFKGPWVAEPPARPDLWCYSARSGMTCYMSWNGATEVFRWRLHGVPSSSTLDSTATPPLSAFSSFSLKFYKTGFETSIHIPNVSYAYTFAEALDKEDISLQNSTIAKPFVPSGGVCDDFSCRRTSLASMTNDTNQRPLREGENWWLWGGLKNWAVKFLAVVGASTLLAMGVLAFWVLAQKWLKTRADAWPQTLEMGRLVRWNKCRMYRPLPSGNREPDRDIG